MGAAHATETAGLALSLVVASVSVLMGFWLWSDRRNRPHNLSDDDARHFARQDLRRGMVVLVFVLLAIGLRLGSKIEHRVGGRPNPDFFKVWFGVMVLLLTLPVLAVFDWLATRFYARRHVRALIKERREILLDELRRRELERRDSGEPDEHE